MEDLEETYLLFIWNKYLEAFMLPFVIPSGAEC